MSEDKKPECMAVFIFKIDPDKADDFETDLIKWVEGYGEREEKPPDPDPENDMELF